MRYRAGARHHQLGFTITHASGPPRDSDTSGETDTSGFHDGPPASADGSCSIVSHSELVRISESIGVRCAHKRVVDHHRVALRNVVDLGAIMAA